MTSIDNGGHMERQNQHNQSNPPESFPAPRTAVYLPRHLTKAVVELVAELTDVDQSATSAIEYVLNERLDEFMGTAEAPPSVCYGHCDACGVEVGQDATTFAHKGQLHVLCPEHGQAIADALEALKAITLKPKPERVIGLDLGRTAEIEMLERLYGGFHG